MKQLLTILFTMVFAQAIFAQKTITIQAENAAEEFAKLSVGEYNIVVKCDLKGKNEWYYDDNNHKPIGLWKVKNVSYFDCESLKIKVLDLSGVIGLDSIQSNIVYALEDMVGMGTVYGFPPISKLILPDNMVYFNTMLYFNTSEAFINVDEVIVSPNNKNFKMQDKFLLSKDGKELYRYQFTSGTSLQIPDGVEIIKSNSIFGWSDDLSDDTINVVLPNSVKELENNCFNNSKLFSVSIPKNVKYISPDYYRNITDISKDNKYYTMENGVIYNKDKTTLFYGGNIEGRFEIPFGVKVIGRSAFCGTNEGASVVIPQSVKWIGSNLFLVGDQEISVEFDDGIDNWYFTTNETDWLKRQNGVPVSEVFPGKVSRYEEVYYDNIGIVLLSGILCRLRVHKYVSNEEKIEYASWYDPKKFDIETIVYNLFSFGDNSNPEFSSEECRIDYIRPFFYKLD